MKTKNNARQLFIKYFMITLGSAIYAIGFQFFTFPNNIISGGVVGIAMLINYFTSLPVGVLTILLNIPLFIIAWRHFGLSFMVSSLIGMAVSSIFVDLYALTGISLTDDAMLAAVIGGAVKGLGLGLVYYTGATTGGLDIIVKIFRQRLPHINFGTLVLIMDVSVIVAYALVLGTYESAMYSMVAMFAYAKVVDVALYGIDNSSVCYIISEKSAEIARQIITGQLHRGVTLLDGEGAYSHNKKQIVMCVIKRNQLAEVRKLVRAVDINAFVILTDAKNVFGNGFGDISEVK